MSRRSESNDSESQPENEIDFWLRWPSPSEPGRVLFVAGLPEGAEYILVSKGYIVVDVRGLPRSNPAEHQEAILSWLQGLTEGSIRQDEERRKQLELEARVHGLMVNRSINANVHANLHGASINELLGLGPSRSTLKSGVTGKHIEAAKRASTIPGEKLED